MTGIALPTFNKQVIACRRCPRLVAWREQVAREKRAAYRDEEYWGRPITGFGFPEGGDAPRVVRDAGCGVCVPPGEPARLAQAIVEAWANPAGCRAWGERGRQFVEANHDRERVVTLYESLFHALTGATTASRRPDRRPPIPAAAECARGP